MLPEPSVGTLDIALSVLYAALLLGFVGWTIRALRRRR
jgi:TRAP-type C4-dicarboxylate transport system permease small subunit